MVRRRGPAELHEGSRRKRMALFPGVILILALVSPSKSQQNTQTWTQLRGSRQLVGVSPSGVPRDLRPMWTYEAGDAIESSAAIADAVVYVGSQTGDLVALGLWDGSVRWKYKAGPIGESSPCVDGGVVYVGDLNGTLHAVGANDGRARWTFKTGGEIKSSPVVVGDRVLVGSYDEHLYCVATASGSQIWKFKTGGPVHCTAGVLRRVDAFDYDGSVPRLTNPFHVLPSHHGLLESSSDISIEHRALSRDDDVLKFH